MSKADAHGFKGKVAVVTGAGRGIGREVALLLGSLGVRTVVKTARGLFDRSDG